MSLFRYCVCLWLLFVFLFIVYCHFCTATLTLVHLYLLRTPPPPTVNIRLDQPSKPERLIYIFYMMNVCFFRISLFYISLLFLAIPNLIPAPLPLFFSYPYFYILLGCILYKSNLLRIDF